MTRRRLLVLSSGSIDASIEGRNAWDRLRAIRLGGYFEEIEYLFFPTARERSERPEEGLTVRDISGTTDDPDSGADLFPRLARLLRGGRRIHDLARDLLPDVVACADPFLSAILAWTLSRRFRVPWTIHLVSNYRLSYEVGGLNPMPFLPPSLTFAVERAAYASADLILPDCGHYAEYSIQRGARRARVHRVPRYADPVFYDTDPDESVWKHLGVADPRPLVYVGRLSPEKYAMELIECFGIVAREIPERQLVVLGGGGPDEEAFLQRGCELGLSDRIRIVRGLDREQLAVAMGSCGVLLAPHAGYALLEGGLVGAPVVAYDYEWHPELIADGRTGRLVPYRDPEAMARAALELLRRPAEAERLGRALRATARRRHRPEAAEEALREAYVGLLEGRG